MASSTRVDFTSPVGRLVQGSLYKGNDKDAEGNVLLHKSGPNTGKPGRLQYFFALAIPKGNETHWAETSWGAIIWQVGHTAFPQAAKSEDFSWKVVDGDSAKVNKEGNAPRDKEGFAGNWVLKFTGGYAPKVYRPEGNGVVQVIEEGYVKTGYYVEVLASADGNGSQKQPGVYVNHNAVCFRAFGTEIVSGPDVSQAGFGVSALPAGASAVPLGSVAMPAAPGVQSLPSPPPPPPSVPVIPNPSFLNVPAIPAAPSAVPAPPASGPQMTAKANGASREQMVAAGWTDANLVAHGFMTV